MEEILPIMDKTKEISEDSKLTLFGKYFKSINGKAAKVDRLIGIPAKSINRLCTVDSKIIYAEDFYKIIVAAHHLAGLPREQFTRAVDEIFPKRIKTDLMEDYKDYSPEAKFFKKYTQQQADIEKKLKYSTNQITKYFADNSKRGLATDIIAFIEATKLNLLETFEEIYGVINFDSTIEEKLQQTNDNEI